MKVKNSGRKQATFLLPLEMMCAWGEANLDDRFELTNPQCSGNL